MKKHIFLVDDDTEEMRFFVAALKELGDAYKCTYASTGAHALKMLKYLTPEIIFINYNMSEMNGLELTGEIRKMNELKHTPVFLYFTYIDTDSRQKALTMGPTHCIKKPAHIVSITEVLKEVFEPEAVAISLNLPNATSLEKYPQPRV